MRARNDTRVQEEHLQNVFTPEEQNSIIINNKEIDQEYQDDPAGYRVSADASGIDWEYSFLDEIFESSPECILILEEGAISRANAASGEFFGIAPDQLIGRTPVDLSPASQPGKEASSMRMEMLLSQGERNPIKFGWIHTAAGGIERKTEVILTPIRVGERTRIMANIRDITPLIDAQRTVASQYISSVPNKCISTLLCIKMSINAVH